MNRLFPICVALAGALTGLRLWGAAGPQSKEPIFADKGLREWIKQLQSKDIYKRGEALRALAALGPRARAAVPALRKALTDEDPFVCFHAGVALGEIGPNARSAIPALMANFRHKNMWVHGGAAIALGQLGGVAVPDLLRVVEGKDQAARSSAIFVLEKIGPEAKAAVPALKRLLKHRSVTLRIEAASALWRITKDPAAVPPLRAALENKDPLICANAARGLGKIGPDAKDAVPALAAVLKDKAARAARERRPLPPSALACNDAVRALRQIGPAASAAVPALIEAVRRTKEVPFGEEVAYTLRAIGPKAVPLLTKALQGKENDHVRAMAVEALGLIGPRASGAVPALRDVLKEARGELRVTVSTALWRIARHRVAVPVLMGALADKDSWVRQRAAEALGEIGPPARTAVPALGKALKDEDDGVRWYAAKALGRIGAGAGKAVRPLEAALKDHEYRVRVSAALALWQISRHKGAIPALVAMLKSKDFLERSEAAAALAEVGPGARSAVADLVKALQDEESYVVSKAVRALGNIGPPAKPAVPLLIQALKSAQLDVSQTAAEALKKIDSTAATRAGVR
jgi:HEAT repeat protein